MQRVSRLVAVSVLLAAVLPLAQAQAVYRIVGPDGRVTFSDQPPPPSAPVKGAAPVGKTTGNAAAGTAALPFELRAVVSRYPVTLYTGPNCNPCSSGRALLVGRGVPFTEKTISTNEDIDALQRMSGDSSLPFMQIGSQQLRGFSDAEWGQFLDAAGYPKTSALPSGYTNPPAAPLVAAKKQEPPTEKPAAPAEPALPAAPVAPPGSNPAGIRF
jgi:glutaredoxin